MGSHFPDWNDYNGIKFPIGLLKWDKKPSGKQGFGRFVVKKGTNGLGSQKLHLLNSD